jgi:hypothetical protein
MKLKEMLDDVKMHEIDDHFRDLGIGGPDSADDDNAGLDPDFKQTPMIMQIGKVLDSRGNPNPIKHVTTDDGKKHDISVQQAMVIKMLLTTDKVKPDTKRAFTKDVQQADTLGMLLQAGDQNAMVKAFLDKYKPGDSPEKSNY